MQPAHPNLLVSRVQVSALSCMKLYVILSKPAVLFFGVICVYHGDHWQRAKSGDRISLINKAGRASSRKFCGRLRTSAWLPKATLANLPVALSPTGPLARPAPTPRLAQGLMLCWGSRCSPATSHLLARFQAGRQADRADLSPGPAGRRPHPPPGARSF